MVHSSETPHMDQLYYIMMHNEQNIKALSFLDIICSNEAMTFGPVATVGRTIIDDL